MNWYNFNTIILLSKKSDKILVTNADQKPINTDGVRGSLILPHILTKPAPSARWAPFQKSLQILFEDLLRTSSNGLPSFCACRTLSFREGVPVLFEAFDAFVGEWVAPEFREDGAWDGGNMSAGEGCAFEVTDVADGCGDDLWVETIDV